MLLLQALEERTGQEAASERASERAAEGQWGGTKITWPLEGSSRGCSAYIVRLCLLTKWVPVKVK